jgi:hypothetical protein
MEADARTSPALTDNDIEPPLPQPSPGVFPRSGGFAALTEDSENKQMALAQSSSFMRDIAFLLVHASM